jgi:hypothetical protein
MRKLLGVAFALGTLSLVSCQRSTQFKHDQDYYQADSESYYNNGGGKSPAQRVADMGQPKKRIIVFDFWNDSPVKQTDIGAFAADELRRGLYLSQRVILPPDLKSELTTEDFVQGDKVKVAQLIREGRKLGVSVLVIGRVTRIVFRQRGDDIGIFRQKQSLAAVDVEMKVFDVAGGREIMATAKSGEASSNAMVAFEGGDMESPAYRAELTKFALRNAVGPAVPEVIRAIEKLTWQGRVAKVAGKKVYVNAGKASGLVVGDILRVMTPGDDIYDPSTGAFLGRTQGQLKGTVEVVDFLGTDGAVTEIHTGGNFQESDLVQLY